MDCAEYIVM